ncbi:MAG: dethiobiotin synthase [Betaproteobacteria bacterium]|nr:dethiobiotin synthase [Betaproteobacteria bacterium]
MNSTLNIQHSTLPRPAGRGYFVTGTDTGVGKTLVACALLNAYAAHGLRVVGMKPVAAGAKPTAEGLKHEDVERLAAASSVTAPREHVNPYCFAAAIAPHIAAREAGVAIALGRIERSFRALASLADVVIVEGVGGFRVPLGPATDTAQLATRLALPVILVVGMRLGCLNHALLTADAIAARGLKLAGWVANHVDPRMAAADENVRALEERIGAPLLARIAFTATPDLAASAALLDTRKLF